jgi:hypothetical protein
LAEDSAIFFVEAELTQFKAELLELKVGIEPV